MKLHLPVGLRAALLAVLLCSPMAMGNVSVYHVASDGTHKDVSLEDAGDGRATYEDEDWWYPKEYVILVDGKTDGNSFTELECKALSADGKTTVTVGQGSTLQFTGGSSLGDIFYGLSSETVVNIDGGTLDAGFSSLSLGAITNIAPRDAKTTVAITLENGGSLSIVTPSIGDIRRNTGPTPMGGTTTVSIEAKSGSTLELGTNQTGSIAYIENDGSESITTISIDGEDTTAQLYAMSIGCIGQRAQSALSTTTLSVTDHAEFSMIHGGNIGCLEEYDSTAHTDIVVSGGASFTMGEESNTHLGRYSYATFMHSTTLQSYAGEVEMNISVTRGEGQEEGGHFTMKSGSIGWCGGIDSKTLGKGAAPKTSLTITVDGGTFYVGEDSNNSSPLIIGGVNDAYQTYTKGVATNETTIAVSNGGEFTIDCVHNNKYAGGGKFLLGQAHYDGATVESYTLNVSENGKFIMTAENMTEEKNPSIAYLGHAYKGGTVKKLAINISTGGSLSIIPSANKAVTQGIGFAEATSSGEVSSITTEINLQDGGKMDIAAAQSDTAPSGIGDVIAKKGGTATANTSISVGGKDSSFTFTSGDIGMVYVDGNASSTGTANTSITVEEGGTFTMTGGRLGYAYAASNGKGTVNQKLSLTMTGGKMEIKGGSIFEKKNTASSSTRTGSIELSGDSVLTIGKNVTIGDVEFDITMHGGTLAGDGISKLKGDVSIDTGEGFTGTIGLGGIEAGRIKQVRINSGDIAIVDIGAGTLTLDAEDILTVGEQSAWDGEGASTAPKGKQALLQFKTEGSSSPSEGCTVDVNGKIALNFDGQYLAEQKGKDGTVTLRVWITNGKLAVAEEGSKAWAEEHFEIGTGWGLEVTSYDAAQGMLILEGTSTVWVATVDGDDGNSHAAADASDLGKYTKVIVDEGTTFTADGDATIRQLEGQNGSQLDLVKGEKIESATITLENVNKEGSLGTGDTAFDGSITAGDGVNLRKTGDATLTVQGTLQAEGDVSIEVGELVLESDNNTVAGVLSMEAKGKLQVKQALTLSGTSHLTAGTITGSGTLTVAEGGELSIEADSGWTLGVSNIHVAGTLSQKKSPIAAENIVVQAGGKWTQESDAYYNPSDKKWVDQLTRTEVGQSIGVENTGTVEQKGTSVSADTITVAGTWTQDKVTLTDESVAQTWNKNHDVHAETRANSIVVQAGGNYNLMDGAISALGGDGDEPGTLDLQVSGTFTMSDGDVAKGGNASITVEHGGVFNMNGSGNIACVGGERDPRAEISIQGGDFTLSGGSSIGNVGTYPWDLKSPCTSTVIIEITEDGGNFTLSGNGQIGIASGYGDTSDITINVKGGKFLVQNDNSTQSSLGEVQQASDADCTNKVEIGINVTGNGQFVLAEGGIGCADFASSANGQCSASTDITVADSGVFKMEGGNLGCKLSDSASLSTALHIELSDQGQMQISGGKVGEGATLDLSDDAVLTQTGGEIAKGTFTLSDGAKLTQSKGTINGGSITLNGSASLTQSGAGTISGSSITLSGSATIEQDGGQITGGSLDLSGSATLTQSSGTIDGASITLSGATMKQTGGEITGGTLDLSGGATLTQSKGTINGGSITLNGSANLTQSDGTIKDSSISLKGGATMTQSNAGTINGTSVTLSGEGTSFVQEGGSIGEGAKFSLSDSATMEQTGGKITGGTLELSGGATMTQSNAGTINGTSVTLSGEGTSFAQEGGSIGEGATFSLSDNATMEQTGGEITGGTLELNDGASLTQSKGTISGASITLSGATMEQKGGEVTDGTLELSGGATLTQTGGQITGGTLELSGGATLTQSDGTINVASITLSGATMEQTGGEITGGTLQLSGGATLTQSDGTINVDSITLSGATMEQTGGEITGGTLQLSGGASLTQSGAGTISGSSITLSGGATMEQTGGEITGGTLQLSGGATMTSAGTINGTSVTLSGEGTSFAQEGGNIDERATFSLGAGAKLTLSGGNMNGAVTMEGEASSYDLGNQAAKGSITMHGGSLANAGNYAGSLAIQTDATYTGALDLDGVDAARITQVQIGASETELHNLKSGSTLTFGEGDNKMVVGEQHVYREGQIEPVGGTMVQFQDGKGQIAFDETGKLQLHLESEVLKGLEGQLEILFTNGSFSGMPEGGQKELEEWLSRHFELEKGMEDIKVLLLHDAEGGHLILTGSTEGIWIASRNGQNVDVADLLNDYSAVIADENLTLTLPTTQEEPTIVNQLQNDSGKYGDFIVTTELGATAGHTVQLHNEDANGNTNFYGNVRVEGTGLEAATLEKTGDAALNVHGNLESSGAVQVKEGTLALGGTANSIGTLAMSGGKLQVDGTLALTGTTEMSEGSSGSISGKGSVKLGSGASLTLAGGVSYEVQNTQLDNGAQMSQKGEAAIKGGVITLSGEGTSYTQSGGTISGATFTLTEGASFAQAGGSIDGGATFSLGDGANLTQSKGTIDGASITLSGGASMRQDGGQLTGGTLELSVGATMTSNGTINGTSVTLSGEGTSYTQAGGSIGEGATFSLSDGATLTLRGGSMNAAVTMEGEASSYDLGNQAAKGSITMHGGNLENAENYAGELAIQTDGTYTGALDLGGVNAARITQVQIGAPGTELHNLKSDSTLTFRAGDEMVVGVQHVYREGQTEPAGGSMVQFQGEKGQIAFDGDSALQLHLKSEVLKGLEGQLEILFTDGSFSGMPEGGQKELEAWLGEHFVLDAGLEDIKVLLLNDAEDGHLILTGSSSGIWIASRNGQNVDVADLLNHYSAVIADKDLTLTLPTTQEETPTIVNQLQNERETHGDFIVKTESGATANHTVQLHNANTNGDNGGTEFYGSIRVEGTGPEAATLEKTGDAALNVYGNVESSGAVEVKEGTLALGGTANSIGTLAMSGGELQVNGTLALTGATEMSEGSSGSISGEGNVKLGSGASLTLAGGVSYGVQNTQLDNGAQMSQKGEAAIKGGSIALSGKGTGYTQAGGTISGTTFTLTEGTSFTQAGGSIGEGATFSLGDGATLTLSGGSMNGAVTMEGKTSRYDLGNQAAQGSITMHGGSLANAGNYAGSLVIQTGDTYTGAVDLGGMDAARITSIQLAGKDTYLTGLKEGSTLTLHTDNSFKVTEQNAWVDGKGGPEGKQAFFQFGTAGAGEVGTGSVVDVASGKKITLNFVGQQIAEAVGEDGGITLNVWITNGQLGGGKTGEAAETWAKEHFVIGTGWGLDVESYDAAQGMLVLKGQSNIWDAAVDGTEDAVGHVSVDAKKLSQFDKVVIDERTTVTAEGPDGVVRQLEGSKDLEIQGSGTVAFENKHEESAFVSTGDTTLHGNMVAGDEVDLRKTGDASLTVEGDLKAGGDVAVEEGKLAIGGNDSFIDGELSLGKKGAGGEEGGTSGTLQVDGKLTLSGGVSEDSQGSITGSGTVVLDGDFTVGDVELGKDLTFQMGEKAASANFGNNAVTLQDLEGKKNVTAGGVTLTGEGTFSGTITGNTTMQGEYTLSGADIDGTLDNSGKERSVMILSDASEEALQVQKDLVLRKDATTRIFMDLSNGDLWQDGASDTMVNVSRNIIIEDETIFEIHNLKDIIASNEDLKNVVIMRGAHVYAVHGRYEEGSELDEGTIGKQQMDENVEVKLTGTLNWRYKKACVSFMNSEAAAAEAAEEKIALFRKAAPAAEASGSTVSLTLIDQDVNPVIAFAETFNEKAGAALLSGHVLRSSINGVDPDVERVAEVIAGAMQSNPSVAHKALAAMAGSTLTSVSAAQSAALRNQTSRVRDHALQAARLRCAGNDEATQQQRPCKTTHVWVEGTSFFSEQHSIGDESGYRLNSWGGAVGIDAQVNAHWSVGLSLAANYGDLEARAADYAKGDLDSYYVSAWSQAKNGRWGNTLLFTVGTNEADLRRTVNYGAGSYTATSNASGSSLGAMWELTCDFHPVKENKSNILQPMFNVAVQHTSMDGFSEKNAGGVGLATEKQTRDTMTLGLGLRWLAAIDSAKAVNRTVSTELHANVAQDLGDRRSVANVALLTDPNFTQSVYGSKTGSAAFQFGAGVNVPMTPNSCIYVNAGGELREHANTWSATLGVRMGF